MAPQNHVYIRRIVASGTALDLSPGHHCLENYSELHEHTCILQTLGTLDAAFRYGQHYISAGEERVKLDGLLALLNGLKL